MGGASLNPATGEGTAQAASRLKSMFAGLVGNLTERYDF